MEELVVRPWGSYQTILRGDNFQVKVIVVNPGEKLSLQSHNHRSENWTIVSGIGEVICGEETLNLAVGEHIYIPVKTKHRMTNNGKEIVKFIEVQNGDYLGEDDIIRYDDVYGRK